MPPVWQWRGSYFFAGLFLEQFYYGKIWSGYIRRAGEDMSFAGLIAHQPTTDRSHFLALHTPHRRAELEGQVRSEAIAAGLREGRGMRIPDAVLDFIVSTSDWTMSPEQLRSRAASIAEHYVENPRAINFHTATQAEIRAYLVGMGAERGWSREYMNMLLGTSRSGDEADVSLASARYDGFSGADAATLSAMRSYAIEQGLHWAANRPEILRLGHEAIRLLARTGFTQQSHDRLHAAGFDHHDMVRLARHAERNGVDVNDLATEVSRAPEIFGGGDAQRAREWTERLRTYFARPDSEEARADMGRALDDMERDGTEEQRDHVRRLRPLLKLDEQARTQLDASRTVDSAQTQQIAGQDRQIENGLGELNDPAPGRVDRAEVTPSRGATVTTATAHHAQQSPRLA